jgi:hypothetical protein
MDWTKVDEDLEGLKELKKQLMQFEENDEIFDDGRRNDDAVDFCCMCWCLGMTVNEIRGEFLALPAIKNHPTREILALDHIERVVPYLDSWGKRGTMDAMQYSINYKEV